MPEKERVKIKARQVEGIASDRARGQNLGRPQIQTPETFRDEYAKVLAHQKTATQAMKDMNLKRNTFYRFVKKINR